jgi:hypothetical protein
MRVLLFIYVQSLLALTLMPVFRRLNNYSLSLISFTVTHVNKDRMRRRTHLKQTQGLAQAPHRSYASLWTGGPITWRLIDRYQYLKTISPPK